MGELRKPSVKSDSTKKEKKIKSVPKSVLEAFENIVDLAKDSNLDENFYKKAENQIDYVVEKLSITPTQVVLLPRPHVSVSNSGKARIYYYNLMIFFFIFKTVATGDPFEKWD